MWSPVAGLLGCLFFFFSHCCWQFCEVRPWIYRFADFSTRCSEGTFLKWEFLGPKKVHPYARKAPCQTALGKGGSVYPSATEQLCLWDALLTQVLKATGAHWGCPALAGHREETPHVLHPKYPDSTKLDVPCATDCWLSKNKFKTVYSSELTRGVN